MGRLIFNINSYFNKHYSYTNFVFQFRALKTSNVRDRLFLKQGIKLAELGVINAVGSTTTPYFGNLNYIIGLMPFDLMGIPWYKLKDYGEKKESSISRKRKDRKFLEHLAHDKQYLERIVKKLSPKNEKSKLSGNKIVTDYTVSDVDIFSHHQGVRIWKNIYPCNNKVATKLLLNEAETALVFLEERKEFWSQQKPAYPNRNKGKTEKVPNWDIVLNRMVSKKHSIFIRNT